MAGPIPTYTPREGLDVGSAPNLPEFSQAPAQAIGMAAEAVGVLAQQRQKRQEELDRFQAEQGFIQLQIGNGETVENAGQNLQPGGQGLHDGVMTDVETRRQAYLATLPPYLRDEYDLRTLRASAEVSLSAAGAENSARDTWFRNELGKSAEQLLPIIRSQGLAGLTAFSQQQIDAINASSLSPAEKEQEIYKWRALSQLAAAEGMTPADLIEMIDPSVHFASALVERESGGRATVVNEYGYAGLYQFGAPRLQELGLYAPGAGENLDSWSRTSVENTGKWSGRFNIPGFPEVRTLTDFLSNPAAQRAAYGRHVAQISEQITARGLDRFIGQTVGGVLVTREGVIAMAHLGGIGGAERFLTSGGEYNPGDSNDTKLSSYLQLGANAMSAGPFDALPYNTRMDLVADARAAIVAADNAAAALRKDSYDSAFNQLLVAINDGTAGYADIGAARDGGWLTDYDDITKAQNAVESRLKEVQATTAAIGKFGDPNYSFNPFAKEDQDATDLMYKAQGGSADLLGGPQQAEAVRRVQDFTARTGMIPESAMTALRGGIWSSNPTQRDGAFGIVDGLVRANPRLLNQLTEADRTRFQDWQALASAGVTADELTRRFDTLTDPATAARRDALRKEGADLAREYALESILVQFDPSGWLPLGDKPSSPRDSIMLAQLKDEFSTLFAERYSVSGNKDIAFRQAIETLDIKWGATTLNLSIERVVTGVGSSDRVVGSNTLMAHPPEENYAEVDGSHDWMTQDLQSLATERYPGFQSIFIRSTAATEAALGTNETPYDVMIVDSTGVLRQIPNVVFDYEKYRAAAAAKFEAERAAIAAEIAAGTRPLPPEEGGPNPAAAATGLLGGASPPPVDYGPNPAAAGIGIFGAGPAAAAPVVPAPPAPPSPPPPVTYSTGGRF